MIISDLKKNKMGLYDVSIEDKIYTLTEESVLKYRLFKGNELTKAQLEECLAEEDLTKIKKKAYMYSLKYLKNSYETLRYLTDREIPYLEAKRAIEALKQEGLLEDLRLASGVVSSLARASNGPYMIRYKLKNRHFEDSIIEAAISSLREEDIIEGKERLLKKANIRYKKLSDYDRSRKLRELFYRHGYEEF